MINGAPCGADPGLWLETALPVAPLFPACTQDGDCHILVADRDAGLLYELYRGNLTESGLEASCSIAWDMTQVYPGEGRGEQCTSADAAGYPITPLLFTADELAAGRIEHAIRFALPNDAITRGLPPPLLARHQRPRQRTEPLRQPPPSQG